MFLFIIKSISLKGLWLLLLYEMRNVEIELKML